MSERAPSWRVRARGLSKEFPSRHRIASTFHVLRGRLRGANGREPVVPALEDVTLQVDDGAVVGIIGDNGAGKTTLLKTIAGIHAPTRGEVAVRGTVGLLSGLGVGMVPDLPVCDNIRLYGAICRLSRTQTDAVFDEIVDWAELRGFVDAPLRHLSTGMRSRLAFAVAMHVQVEILLMDEALVAGDQRFRKKGEAYFESLGGSGMAVLVATHDLRFVERYCSQAVWLRGGRLVACGPTADVAERYRRGTE